MHTLFLSGIGRLATIFALGLALWVAAGAGRAIAGDHATADDQATADDLQACDSKAAFREGAWYVNSDGMAMQRVFSGLGPVATEGSSPTGSLALSQHDLDDPFQSGARLLVGHSFEDTPYQLEVSYFWLSASNTFAQANDSTGNLVSPFTNFGVLPDPTGAFDLNTLVQIHQVSQLEGGEVNWKCEMCLPPGDPRIVLLLGVRHINVREQFDYLSQQAPFSTNAVSVHSRTNNNLWGPQIGGLVDYGCPVAWLRFEGKAAICDNQADRDLEAGVNATDTTHPRLFHSGTASVGDISASILWHPIPALTGRVGYQALWIDQLALASRNFVADPAALTDPAAVLPINTRGTLIYHGPFAGLQLSW